jgi:hypothetical protein
VHTTTPSFFFLLDGISGTFLTELSWNHDLLDFSLQRSLGDMCSSFAQLLVEMGLENYLLGLTSNLNPPNFSLPSSLGLQA